MSSHIHSRPTLFSIILLKKEKKSACAQLFSLLQFIRKFTIWPVFPPGFHHFLAAFSSSLLLFFLTGILKRLKLRREALLSEGSGVLLSFFCSTLNYFWWEMEIISPATHFSGRNWLINESESHAKWTPAENKTFENALAVYDKDTPDRWQKVAVMIPGKTVADVMRQYKELEVDVSNIEAGLIPIPGYGSSSFKLDCVDSHGYDAFNHSYVTGGKRSLSGRAADQERKKGIPWTEEEHKRFLMGLKKYGKGDWRNISRNFVITRTPTQVASHAQKYFIRQLSGGKDKRRASIHDITTVNLNDVRTPSPDNKKPSSPCQSAPQQPDSAAMSRTSFQWSQSNGGVTAGLYSMQGNTLMFSPHGMSSYGNKMQGQNLPRDAIHESYIGPQSIAFQMQSSQNYPHG